MDKNISGDRKVCTSRFVTPEVHRLTIEEPDITADLSDIDDLDELDDESLAESQDSTDTSDHSSEKREGRTRKGMMRLLRKKVGESHLVQGVVLRRVALRKTKGKAYFSLNEYIKDMEKPDRSSSD